MSHAATHDGLPSCFEARSAKLQGELKLTVKRTFLAVEAEEEYFEGPEIELPTPLFELSASEEEWRQEYRKFRCGFHRGSKGEITDLARPRALSF